MLARREDSVVALVDLQPAFVNAINENERVLKRSRFLLEAAFHLSLPVIATEQYPSRMGPTEDCVLRLLAERGIEPIGKMFFSCAGSPEFMARLNALGRPQVILIGIETHICISQTAHHLFDKGLEVLVGADAVGSRSKEMHEIGLRRMAAHGITIAHTESIVYEWLQTAEAPEFKRVLAIVKDAAD